MPAKYLYIRGLVQGVGYRESMRREAEKLGISGWVRNRADGSVEALVSGSEDAVNAIVAWANSGPRFSRVEHVYATEAGTMVVAGFTVIAIE